MRVLQGRADTAAQGEGAAQENGSAAEASYEQGYQQAPIWNEIAEEAGATAKADGEVEMDRVPVINTKSGRLICGAAAPMKKNLDIYLRDRPYMQVFDSLTGNAAGKKRVQDSDGDNLDTAAGIKSRDVDGQDLRGGQTETKKSSDAANGMPVKKRFKPMTGPQTGEAMDQEVLSALETWSDAMQEASEMLDKDSCSSVLEELLALHERVQMKQNVGDTASLRALIVSQFPKTCLDILRSLGDFDTMRLTECVTAALNIDQQMSDGKNLGDEELSALGREKILELDKLGQRNEQLSKELDVIRSAEARTIEHHTEELNKTKETIQQLRAEEEQLKAQLREISAESEQHLSVLQKVAGVHAENAEHANIADAPTSELCGSILKGDEMQREMSELLRTRGSVDRARDGVNAAQSHLNLMHDVCEFSTAVRDCMETYCFDELLRSLSHELEVLRQDKRKLEYIAEQLKDIGREEELGTEAARPGVVRTASLREKYKRFYTERIRDMRSKHFKSRHAACGLLVYFEPDLSTFQRAEDAPAKVKKVVSQAKDIVAVVDALQKTADDTCLQKESFPAVPADKPGSTLVIHPARKEKGTLNGSLGKCVEEVQSIARKPALQGRLAVQACDVEAGKELCGIIDAVHGGLGGSSLNLGHAAAAAGCVCHALDEVCAGKSRTAVCLVPYVVLQTDSLAADRTPRKTAKFPLLSAALLHARVEHSWMQRIAVIDLVRPSVPMKSWVDAQIVQISPIANAEEQQELEAETLVCREQWAASKAAREDRAQEEASRDGPLPSFVDRWKQGMEKTVLPKLKELKPQLIVVNIESVLHLEAARNARTLSAQNFAWAGRFIAQHAGPLASGRLVVVWDMAGNSTWIHRSVGDFVRGMLEAHGVTL